MAGRHVFIGDIHGCRDEVIDLLRRIRLRRGDVVVAVGDLVRKGPLAREVVAMWMANRYLAVLDGSRIWRQVPKGREQAGDRFWSEVWRGDRAAIGLNTGCVYGGKLTAVIFDGQGRWTIEQVQARRRYST